MKRLLSIAIAATFALAASSAYAALTGTYSKPVNSVAGYVTGDAANGIWASRHNLGSLGNFIHSSGSHGIPNYDQTGISNPLVLGPSLLGPSGSSEVCVFCHTPHHTVTATTNGNSYSPAPLWNRMTLAPASSFKAYGTTIGGTTINNGDIGSVTLACLSCHDGVTTFDVMANAPGAGGLAVPTGTAQALWGLTTGSGPNSGFYDENNGQGSNTLGNEPRLNIGNTGADLSNDHPLSVVYSDGTNGTTAKASLRPRTTTISTIDLRTGLALSTTNSAELNNNLSQNRWAVEGSISDTATIDKLLRNGKVECSSCHDPHFKNLSNVDLDNTTLAGLGVVAASDGLFLRRVGGNAGSGVCRTCHNK